MTNDKRLKPRGSHEPRCLFLSVLQSGQILFFNKVYQASLSRGLLPHFSADQGPLGPLGLRPENGLKPPETPAKAG